MLFEKAFYICKKAKLAYKLNDSLSIQKQKLNKGVKMRRESFFHRDFHEERPLLTKTQGAGILFDLNKST
jgi:hypothetical protein